MPKTYTVEVLQPQDKTTLEEVSHILADVFAGVQVGERFIQEPMITAAGIRNQGFYEFTRDYLQVVVSHGLTVYARDNDTGRVVGAVASEAFNPNEEVPTFEGEQAGWNAMYPFLEELDAPIIEKFEHLAGRKMTQEDIVHLFLLGIKAEHNKGQIAQDLIDLLFNIASEKGFKGIFAEATNPKSQKVLRERNGYHVPTSVTGELVEKAYSEAPFNTIPVEVATECQIMYKAIDKNFEL